MPLQENLSAACISKEKVREKPCDVKAPEPVIDANTMKGSGFSQNLI